MALMCVVQSMVAKKGHKPKIEQNKLKFSMRKASRSVMTESQAENQRIAMSKARWFSAVGIKTPPKSE